MISVIIPAYNEEKAVGKTLNSLVRQTYKEKFEVILVDNNSEDNTVKVAEKFLRKLPLKIILEKKQGRGAAKDRGAREAKGEILAYLDADTKATRNWLARIEENFSDKKIVAVTGPWRIDDIPDSSLKWFLESFQETAQLPYRVPFGHYWLNGMNMAFRASAYRKCGGINKNLNVHDDVDISTRIGKLGKIKYDKKLLVYTSGRRYKNGFLSGLMSYHKHSLEYLVGKRADLEDIR